MLDRRARCIQTASRHLGSHNLYGITGTTGVRSRDNGIMVSCLIAACCCSAGCEVGGGDSLQYKGTCSSRCSGGTWEYCREL
eukprot:1880374-Prymnesium_polylepis.1